MPLQPRRGVVLCLLLTPRGMREFPSIAVSFRCLDGTSAKCSASSEGQPWKCRLPAYPPMQLPGLLIEYLSVHTCIQREEEVAEDCSTFFLDTTCGDPRGVPTERN